MKAFEVMGRVDEARQLHAAVPGDVPAGQVRVIVLIPEEDEAGAEWDRGVAREWSPELEDIREDIYTVSDGEPINGAR